MSPPVRPVDLDLLDRRADARAVDEYEVKAIANSMGDVGQLSAIRVRPKESGRFEIMAGVHRVEACRLLGLTEIDAIVEDIGELFAELTMIDENLCRSDLGPADRARQTARRKAIYLEIHPETQHGSPGVSRQVGDTGERSDSPRFTEDTAQASGKSERTVQRDAERGEKISPDVLDLVRGTELDTGTYLDGLKKFSPDQQRMLVERDLEALDAAEVNGARAIAARRLEPADSLDFFPTPPWATRALIEIVLPKLGLGPHAKTPSPLGRVWEPACGEGHMSGVLCEYSDDVLASDIAGYGTAEGIPPGWYGRHDFLDPAFAGPTPPADWIITNPPFGELSLQFALRALGLAQVGVALFVRQQWLEGVGRFAELFSKYPPALVAQFAERVNLKKGEWDPEGDTLTSYIWVVWTKGDRLQNGDTLLMWIPPGQRTALSRPDDVERFTAHPVRVPGDLKSNSPEIPDSSNSTILPASGEWSDAFPAVEPGDGDDAARPAPASGEVGQHASPITFAAATPILQARYATEDGQGLADELGIKLNTLRSWAFRLKLTSQARNVANGLAHAGQLKGASNV